MSSILGTYTRKNISFSKGKGCYLYDINGEKYLDFVSGIAVNSLGHCHEHLVKIIQEQSRKLWHVSNAFIIPEQEKLAKRLTDYTFADFVCFQNSGTEATEASIKIARKYFHTIGQPKKKRIITFKGAFHGRTIAALFAANNPKHIEGFDPKVDGFDQVPFADHESLKKIITNETAAIMIETIQGEGGIKEVPDYCLKGLRKLCDEKNLLLILDEVQCGFGRSGKLFSYEWSNIEPDVMAVAKGIGSGFPMGACLATNKASVGMTKGMHGSTYGGNPLSVSVGKAVITEIMSDGFLQKVDNIAKYLWKKLKELENEFEEIIEVRGAGLMLGLKTKTNNQKICELLIEKGLLTVPANDNIVRLTPPLIITNDEVDQAIEIIHNVIKGIDD
jgi:acetylornithine/N-succinyldiaminopimelate aminotransferase